MPHVLLTRLDHVGDCVLTVPALATALRRTGSNVRVSLLTTSRSAALMRWCEALDEIVIFDAPWSVPHPDESPLSRLEYVGRLLEFSMRKRRHAGGYDHVIHLSFSAIERFLCRNMAPSRIGFEGPYQSVLHRRTGRYLTEMQRFNPSLHMVENCHRLAQRIVPRLPEAGFSRLSLPADERRKAISRLSSLADLRHGVIGIHPGGDGSTKNWPLESFALLVRRLHESTGMPCLIFGGPIQRESMERVIRMSDTTGGAMVLTPDLVDFASLVSPLSLFIANDGGPAHVAAAMGIPTLALFGPTDERVYGPRGPHTRTLRSAVSESRPDYPWAPGPRIVPPPSLLALSVSDVDDAARQLLASFPPRITS